MMLTQPGTPLREQAVELGEQPLAAVEFNPLPLLVFEGDGVDVAEPVKRPGKVVES